MKLEYARVGELPTNCYIISDEKSGESAAIDCAVYDTVYEAMLKRAGIKNLKYILLTHGHFDHICGAAALREKYGGKICIHPADARCLESEAASLNAYVGFCDQTPCFADMLLNDGDRLFLGKTEIGVIHTPGHTPGGVCFTAENYLFCGDSLLRLSAGRTDLPGGSAKTLRESLIKLCGLSENYILLPGHGEKSTLYFEKDNNIYMRQI